MIEHIIQTWNNDFWYNHLFLIGLGGYLLNRAAKVILNGLESDRKIREIIRNAETEPPGTDPE